MKSARLLLCLPAALPALPALAAESTAPIDYQIEASTDANQLGAALSGGGMAELMRRAMRGQEALSGPSHSLRLELSTSLRVNEARASHDIPTTMNMGPTLVLAAPEMATAGGGMMGMPNRPDGASAAQHKPQGRLLLYWGCGEQPGAGQPKQLEFAKMSMAEAMALSARMRSTLPMPISRPLKDATQLNWPNRFNPADVPADGSLLGEHRLSGNVTPTLQFSIPAGYDFMPPLALTQAAASPTQGAQLSWQPLAGATGYALTAIGPGPREGDMVLWSSSAVEPQTTALTDYQPPAEAARLVRARLALPPDARECRVPAGVFTASDGSPLLQMVAWGPELIRSGAEQGRNWKVRLRLKSSSVQMLGQEPQESAAAQSNSAGQAGNRNDAPAPGRDDSARAPAPEAPSKGAAGQAVDMVKDKLKGLLGF